MTATGSASAVEPQDLAVAVDGSGSRPELPTTRAEDWRYAPLKDITAALDAALGRDGSTPADDAEPGDLLDDLPPGGRVVLVDGRYVAHLSDPTGVEVAVDAEPDDAGVEPQDGFEEWNRMVTGAVVRICPTSTTDGTLNLVHLTTSMDGPAHPRVEITVAGGGRTSVVETFRCTPGATFTNATTTIHAEADARAEHLVVLEGPDRSAHVVRTVVVADAHAHVDVGVAAIGSGAGHHRLSVAFQGPGAEVGLTGLTVSEPGTHHDTLASVRHLASHGTSRQQFASIVADGGRASFTGQVVVAHGTVGTDADQQSRNLLLGRAARVDTRPWLEIHSDEVACTHGATVGRLDDDGVFYLRSRGIPDQEARTMLMRAFATTIVDRLASSEPVRAWVDAAVTRSIDSIVGVALPEPGDAR